jgi:hypothetical protein
MDTYPDPGGSRQDPPADERPAADQQTRRSLGATLRAPWARVLVTSLVVLAALAFVFDRALPGGLGSLFPPNPTRVVMPTTTPIIPTPAPAGVLLPVPPTNCPSAPSLDSIIAQPSGFTQPVQLFGQSPVWVPQDYLPQGTAYLDQLGTPEPYPSLKILWAIGPTQHPEVTVRVTDLQTGESAWWTNQNGTPATPVLDLPAQADTSGSGWITTPTTVAITHSGCYQLNVSWTGAGWHTIFAAGGSSRP